jgi:hypothetical protein
VVSITTIAFLLQDNTCVFFEKAVLISFKIPYSKKFWGLSLFSLELATFFHFSLVI